MQIRLGSVNAWCSCTRLTVDSSKQGNYFLFRILFIRTLSFSMYEVNCYVTLINQKRLMILELGF